MQPPQQYEWIPNSVERSISTVGFPIVLTLILIGSLIALAWWLKPHAEAIVRAHIGLVQRAEGMVAKLEEHLPAILDDSKATRRLVEKATEDLRRKRRGSSSGDSCAG